MKILIFSDTHGNPAFMEQAVREHLDHGAVDLLFHLGDGWRDFVAVTAQYPSIPAYAVKGNCDEWSAACKLPTSRLVEADGHRFFLTHGHHFHVKDDVLTAALSAAREKADILVYGHTHLSDDHREDTVYGPVRCINPGSAGAGFRPSYGVLELIDGQILCGFGSKML